MEWMHRGMLVEIQVQSKNSMRWSLRHFINWKFMAMPFYLTITLFHLSVQCIKMKDKNHSATYQLLTDAKVEAPILWSSNVKNWLIEKDLMLGKIEGRRRRGWQRIRWLNGITDSMNVSLGLLWEMVGSLEHCSPWGHKESDMIELNWTNYQPTLPQENRIWAFSAISNNFPN